MLNCSEIRQVQIELTTRCNARCPMCMRNYRGMDFNSGYPVTELTLDNIKQLLPVSFLKQLTKGVSFNGNLGDFGLARDAREIVHYLVELGVPVYINSNGSMRTTEWWASLALPGVCIGFALDGLADTHSLYRLDTDWNKVIENATAFIQAGGDAVWRFVPFDHNRHQQEDCKKLSKELGFSDFENIDEGRNRGPAFNRTGQFTHHLGKPYDTGTPDIKPLLESHLTWFDPATIKIDKDRQPLNINCHHKRTEEIYISASGSVFPCCFLGFYPDTMAHPGNKQLLPLVHENNLFKYDLEHCMEWFDKVEETWKKDSIAEGRLYGCVNSCGR